MKIENRPILILTEEEKILLNQASSLLWDIAQDFSEKPAQKYAEEAASNIDFLNEVLERTDWAKDNGN